jgi:hypothetical protein
MKAFHHNLAKSNLDNQTINNEDLSFISQVFKDSLIEFNNRTLDSSSYLIIALVERAEKIVNSIIILNKYQINEDLEFSMGLIIRTLMSDFITLLYYFSFIEQGFDLKYLDEKAKSILGGGVRNLKKNIDKFKIGGILNENEAQRLFNEISKRYDSQFPSKPEDSLTGKQIEHLNNHKELKEIALRAYDFYIRYSKYEHLSILYYEMKSIPLESRIEDMKKSIILIKIYTSNLINALLYFNDESKQLSSLNQKINDYIGLK